MIQENLINVAIHPEKIKYLLIACMKKTASLKLWLELLEARQRSRPTQFPKQFQILLHVRVCYF